MTITEEQAIATPGATQEPKAGSKPNAARRTRR